MAAYGEIFIIGLLGSMHCIGMCGGFVAMYSLKMPADGPSLPYHVLYNVGRTTTYAVIGGVMGFIGSLAQTAAALHGFRGGVLLFAGAMMVLMGLNIAGVLGRRGMFEDAGITELPVFRKTLQRILKFESAWGALMLGLLLGFLPCGLLYPVFMNAAASGGFLSGATIMVVFGLGAMPALMAFGLLVTKIKPHFKIILYRIAAVLIIFLGVRTFLKGMVFNGWISR